MSFKAIINNMAKENNVAAQSVFTNIYVRKTIRKNIDFKI